MAKHKDRWHGTLVMVGQPAEEGGGGASAMLKDGLFTRFPLPDFALSLHDDDTMPAGMIGYHPGPAFVAYRNGSGEAEIHEKQADLLLIRSREGTVLMGA